MRNGSKTVISHPVGRCHLSSPWVDLQSWISLWKSLTPWVETQGPWMRRTHWGVRQPLEPWDKWRLRLRFAKMNQLVSVLKSFLPSLLREFSLLPYAGHSWLYLKGDLCMDNSHSRQASPLFSRTDLIVVAWALLGLTAKSFFWCRILLFAFIKKWAVLLSFAFVFGYMLIFLTLSCAYNLVQFLRSLVVSELFEPPPTKSHFQRGLQSFRVKFVCMLHNWVWDALEEEAAVG